MHFERSLSRATYPPWKDKYIDYAKLKSLLRDSGSDSGSAPLTHDGSDWTEDDEGAFVEELVNVQLEKVHSFQSDMLQRLQDRTSACEADLDPIGALVKQPDSSLHPEGAGAEGPSSKLSDDQRAMLDKTLKTLDSITSEMNELEKFSRINYAGFLKATKKHDRKRGTSYRIRPLMQVRLAALPFNKEDYSPLLFRLSTMYSFVRQTLDDGSRRRSSVAESHTDEEEFTSHKFWVHPENILELKTVILRRLPVLVYNPQSSKVAMGGRTEPTITSIYFDNPSFDLYNTKVEHKNSASSLRMRWYGSLSDNPEILCERKTVTEDDVSREERVSLKNKYVQRFIDGEYKMGKDIQKLKDRFGADSEQVKQRQAQIDDIQGFIEASELQPVLRANYARTAFQIPGDGRIRITLDTDIAMIREDALDPDRPCRDPSSWHRADIDDHNVEYPFETISKGEINRFPYALLEIRIRGHKRYEWTQDLMNSHLVHAAPRFSKFVHGVAQLFDDYVNTFPFWTSEVDTDIRKDPQEAFEVEQARRAQAAQDEFAVGSLLRTAPSPAFKAAQRSPMGSPNMAPKYLGQSPGKGPADNKITPAMTRKASQQAKTPLVKHDDASSEEDADQSEGGFRSLFPSLTKLAHLHKSGQVKLPPGVHEPSFWIKDEGEVKVEAKVWLANQRTFIKWQHVGVLLSSISLGLYNAAGSDNNIARALGIVYTAIGVFTALWGYGMYLRRSTLIRQRSGKDFDNVIGPVVVCVALMFALVANFAIKYHAVIASKGRNSSISIGYGTVVSDEL